MGRSTPNTTAAPFPSRSRSRPTSKRLTTTAPRAARRRRPRKTAHSLCGRTWPSCRCCSRIPWWDHGTEVPRRRSSARCRWSACLSRRRRSRSARSPSANPHRPCRPAVAWATRRRLPPPPRRGSRRIAWDAEPRASLRTAATGAPPSSRSACLAPPRRPYPASAARRRRARRERPHRVPDRRPPASDRPAAAVVPFSIRHFHTGAPLRHRQLHRGQHPFRGELCSCKDLRSIKRIKLSPESDYYGEGDGAWATITRLKSRKDYVGESRSLMQRIKQAPDLSAASSATKHAFA
jgi:hypothetical protein